jgi:hypothetical protein
MPGPLALPPSEVRLMHISFRAQFQHSLLGEVFLDPCPAYTCASVRLMTQIQWQPQPLCPQRSLLSGPVESHYNTLYTHIPLTYTYITHTRTPYTYHIHTPHHTHTPHTHTPHIHHTTHTHTYTVTHTTPHICHSHTHTHPHINALTYTLFAHTTHIHTQTSHTHKHTRAHMHICTGVS